MSDEGSGPTGRDLEGRVAIVTGAASGIGRATAVLAAAHGARVALLDRNADGAAATAGEIGTAARPYAVDIADPASIQQAIGQVRSDLGPIDIVVNAAGIAAGGPLDNDNYVDTWERTLAVNLTGAMHVVRACLDDLARNASGRIVNVASTEALAASRLTGPYTVSKHGVLGFTRALAVDLGRRGVTANCVCPGATLTGMTGDIPAAHREQFAKRHIPAGRYGLPEEIAYMIVALCSPSASFVNGAVIAVDGGMTAQGN